MILVALTRQVWSYDDSFHLWLWLESPLVTWTCASTSPNKLLFCLRSTIAKLPAPLLSDEITIFVCREVFSRCVSTAKFRSFFSVNANDRRRISRKSSRQTRNSVAEILTPRGPAKFGQLAQWPVTSDTNKRLIALMKSYIVCCIETASLHPI